MTNSRIARFAGIAAGAVLALGFAGSAAAQTVDIASLQAQIALLMQQIQALQGGSTTVSTGVSFTRDLTVGSTGSDVTALQQTLVSKGYLTMPAGVAFGYFGTLTKNAVAAWQAASGVSPAAGYFGPKSRASFGSVATGGTTTGGTVSTGGTTSSTGSITTPGREGILTVTAGPISNTVANVGQTMVPVLTIRAQAQSSDIDVQRVTLDLGTNTAIFNKLYSKIYLVDAATGNVLASEPLNSSTAIQSGNDYLTTITGFHFIVPMGGTRDIAVKADLYSSIDSALITNGGTFASGATLVVPVNGVRGIDGAGVDQFGPATGSTVTLAQGGTVTNAGISQTITVNRSLIDNAQASVSLAPSSPLNSSVPVTDTVNGQLLQVPVMAFNVNAQNDSLHLHQVQVTFTGVKTGANTATATTAYLFNGSTQIASASINSSTGVAIFSNITDGTPGASIPAGTTVPFTIKADVSGVTTGSLALSAVLNTSSAIIYNSQDSNVTPTGSAISNTLTVLGKGPAVSLISSSITPQTVTNQGGNATTTITATFNVDLKAVGSDVQFGTQASSSPTFVFDILKNGVSVGTVLDASSSSFQIPSNVVNNGNNTFTLAQNNDVTVPVTFSFENRLLSGLVGTLGSGQYSVNLKQVNYEIPGNPSASLIFMAGQTAWTTNTVQGLQ